MSGYDIKKRVKLAMGAITSASYGTLYPTLHKLLADGCVEMQEVPQRSRPSKKVYSITEQGRAELQVWLKQPATADQIKREFLLKLYLASNLSKQETMALIANRRAETESLLETLRADQRKVGTPQQRWVMDFALLACEAEWDWLKRIETEFSMM